MTRPRFSWGTAAAANATNRISKRMGSVRGWGDPRHPMQLKPRREARDVEVVHGPADGDDRDSIEERAGNRGRGAQAARDPLIDEDRRAAEPSASIPATSEGWRIASVVESMSAVRASADVSDCPMRTSPAATAIGARKKVGVPADAESTARSSGVPASWRSRSDQRNEASDASRTRSPRNGTPRAHSAQRPPAAASRARAPIPTKGRRWVRRAPGSPRFPRRCFPRIGRE